MKKAIIIISVLLVIGGVVAYYFVNANKYKPPVWKTTFVDTGSISVVVTSTGSITPVTTVQVGAQVSGKVTNIYTDFDSVVKKNQIIAILDTTLLYPTMLNSAAAVEKAKVQVELTKRQFERIDTLFRAKVMSQNDHDIAKENYDAAKADLLAAKATLANVKTNLTYATIRSPVSGTVISRNVDIGQTVISSFSAPQLFTIAKDLTMMQDLANVDEADIGQIKNGQEAIFTVDAYPYDTFQGKVAQIRLQAVNIQNVNNYIVVINVENPDLKLLPGLTATTYIRTSQHDHIMKVLANAIHFYPPADYLRYIKLPDADFDSTQMLKVAGNQIPKAGSKCYIWVERNNSLSPLLVTVGLFDGTYIEIAGNVVPGDEVVIGTTTAQATSTTANNPFMPQMHPSSNKK